MTTTGIVVSASGRASAKKDALETLDYVFNWAPYLDPLTDFIDSFRIIADPGVAVVANQEDGYRIATFISGGVLDEVYRVVCEITTDSVPPRVVARSVNIKIVER